MESLHSLRSCSIWWRFKPVWQFTHFLRSKPDRRCWIPTALSGFSLVNELDTGLWLVTDWRLHDIPDSQVAHSLHGSVPHERLCPDYFVIIIVWVSSSQASLWYRMNQMSAGKTTGFLLHLKFCQNNIAAGQQKGESGWLSPAPPHVIRTWTYFIA